LRALLEQYSWEHDIKGSLQSCSFSIAMCSIGEMEWIKISVLTWSTRFNKPAGYSIPREVHRLINTVRKLRSRIVLLVILQLGLRIQ